MEPDFLSKLNAAIESHLANEQFGVAELADEMGMSRSNLLRKLKKYSELSVSQYIRKFRLERALHLLQQGSLNVSEVGYQVGFSSTSYFIKCFREQYGYSPGEAGKQPAPVAANEAPITNAPRRKWIVAALLGLLLTIAVLSYYLLAVRAPARPPDISIAVLPFKNDSNDSSNVYLINGLMESLLNNLQKIKGLRVISRTSVEKYRNVPKTIPELADELNVRYFVEGSGQKVGNQILLNIQLIDSKGDKHLWARQYTRETGDIFQLQQEVAQHITENIRVVITPAEAALISSVPTENLEAYDCFLKGKDLANVGNNQEAIQQLQKAIELDPTFSAAYGQLAFIYYYMDIFKANKQYTQAIGELADKALFHNAQSGEGIVAKALYYLQTKSAKLAVPYLERALEQNPGSAELLNLLSNVYTNHIPNTGKYLEYALKGSRLEVNRDSIVASYTYLHLSNALIQNGFVDEAMRSIEQSLRLNPKNPYAHYVGAFIHYAKHGDLKETRRRLIAEFQKDSSRIDILQDIGKVSYYLRDYEAAYRYDQHFFQLREALKLDVYRHEHGRMAMVYLEMGDKAKADELFEDFREYMLSSESMYKGLALAAYELYKGNHDKALELMEAFTKEDDVQYWVILFMEDDPQMDVVRDHPRFKAAMKAIKDRFWKNHRELRRTLEDEGLI